MSTVALATVGLLMVKRMICPKCKKKTTVYNSRPHGDTIRRHRKCLSCDKKFATLEILEEVKQKPTSPPKAKPTKRRVTAGRKKVMAQKLYPKFEDLDFDEMTDEDIENALDYYR